MSEAKVQFENFKITDPAEMLVKAAPLDRHPGVFIRDVILPTYNLKIAPLAQLIGVNRPNLSNVLHGKSDVSRDLAYRLGALLNDHLADFLIGYQNAWNLQQDAGRREEITSSIKRLEVAEVT